MTLLACSADPAPSGTATGPALVTNEPPLTSAVATSATPVGPTSRGPGGTIPPLPDGPTGPAHALITDAARAARPARMLIPSIGVDTRLEALGLDRDGALQTPTLFPVAGWYAGGVRPGDTGPAVVAGHVDSTSGPAVFYRLRDLAAGSRVSVLRADGSTVRFVTARTDEYPKNRFPTAAVYGPSPIPVLRLITCSGDFDAAKHSYVDNLVVTAYLAAP